MEKIEIVREEIRKLTKEDFDKILYTLIKRNMNIHNYPGAPSIEDFLHDAIHDALTGRRTWREDLDIKTFLMNIVRSKISNFKEKKGIDKNAISIDQKFGDDDNIHDSILFSSTIGDSIGSVFSKPDYTKERNRIIDKMIGKENLDLKEQILLKVSNDSLLTRIVEYVFDNPGEPVRARNIAAGLNIDIKDVYNANKRLKRLLKDLIR
ncbi:hypothetical protein MTBBW1_2500021 [Desulfamplus magnetovallimortis]|uniref:Uncharacterized protein n=1 Tax=Desulfamplus magnetovallimortis TaxID=1246637 RepID=A0A1W1HES3_9BACT|nr:hypothetical protein [Desulfamplus magnetovallimortis]SLM30872.1 hypothetical protein MTBBW1_2500021 [Desulfamplus magnetovallimortis]